ncbi:(2Fe-2S) ferredoxin domain-containing protein [Microcoleus sp. FACHB-672]|uniref:(2Fe-2S) ferredoxin domain-containing protein n=1 Tax=Microcoleus sp. FACHB-672 TaxID=2692825 RepID=UPI001689CFFA|nr:(2Fe-2S) ferredoxin domain-containing protein [Microcoleus sp. FACHB-672]MBD2041404.1 (2Fe-2S) ferredoxin domain-containing protein [Microcoleus sp. FACHB-672]
MGKSNKQISDFSIEGRFLSFVLEDGYKIKYLRLGTGEGELWIKLSKPLRGSVEQSLIPGSWVRVAGEKKLEYDTGKLKLKAHLVEPAYPATQFQTSVPKPAPAAKPKATILVCQKSDCCKRGAQQVCQALEKTICDRGLEGEVTVKGTGCMKLCKAGPAVMVLPDKTRYTRLHPSEVPALVDKHFSGNLTPEVASKFH